MKVFQIVDRFCYWDASMTHPSLESIMPDQYPSSLLFVKAPDYVREGWGYDPTKAGDARFIVPTPPEGWLYDYETGTFYPDENYVPPPPPIAPEEAEDMRMALTKLGVTPEEEESSDG